ncbi:hypothetical protein LT330_004206 [Penicillium expansum]|nr:hypothetical protein LT330_004206 [Penicillium expansum]
MSGAFVMSSKTRGGNNDAIEWVVAAREDGPINSRKTWTAEQQVWNNEECKPKPEMKATKSLATRNGAVLSRTHLISAALHLLFLVLHFVFQRPRSLKPYFFLAVPTLAIEYYLDRMGRPRYNEDGSLRSAGDDLNATGLTEYMWDVLYWTQGCIVAACLFNDRAWWLWAVIPLYSVYAAYTTIMGVKKGFAGMGGGDAGQEADAPKSKTQLKKEKRGSTVKYR